MHDVNRVTELVSDLVSELSPVLAGGGPLDPSSSLEALGFDSLTVLDLLFSIESALDIQLTDAILLAQEDWTSSVTTLVSLVERLLAAEEA